MAKIMISAGEVSGDLHASHLMMEIKKLLPDVKFVGIGGDRMQSVGMELIYHIRQMGIVGFSEVIKQLPFIRSVFRTLKFFFKQSPPDLLILIDYPGFNLRLAKLAKKYQIPVMYYIAPQIWAWGYWRVEKLVKYVDRAAVIFPFEERILNQAGVKATYVGHPLLDFLTPVSNRNDFFQKYSIIPENKILGLLPGSRISEVNRLLPEMLLIAQQLKEKYPDLQVLIAGSESVEPNVYQSILEKFPASRLLERATYNIMNYADALLIASGTATLEAALFGTPMAIVYRTSRLTYWLAKFVARVQCIGLPNILAEKIIVPEFIQNQFKVKNVLKVMEELLFNPGANAEQRKELAIVRQRVGEKGAAARAARLAVNFIHPKIGVDDGKN
ncbi:lipid-A-disaccharide synthase [candidate division KSB1 bacterium]|nr:lipid-A-disaccharide synthase [candidate division KSB1 bacterium]